MDRGHDRKRQDEAERALRIAMLAPPCHPVRAPERRRARRAAGNVGLLSAEFVRQGHSVTLLPPPAPRLSADAPAIVDSPAPSPVLGDADEIEHVAAVIEAAAAGGGPFDLIHDHRESAALVIAERFRIPLVHTPHSPLSGRRATVDGAYRGGVTLVASSRSAQAGWEAKGWECDIVPDPVRLERWPLRAEKEDYLVWMSPITADSGADLAIDAAVLAGRKLLLAGSIQAGSERFFARELEPRLVQAGPPVTHVSELGETATAKHLSHCAGLCVPVKGDELGDSFAIEALACGTPVIASPESGAAEVIRPGQNGFLAADEVEMAAAIAGLGGLVSVRCRESVSRHDVRHVAAAYVEIYRDAAAHRPERVAA